MATPVPKLNSIYSTENAGARRESMVTPPQDWAERLSPDSNPCSRRSQENADPPSQVCADRAASGDQMSLFRNPCSFLALLVSKARAGIYRAPFEPIVSNSVTRAARLMTTGCIAGRRPQIVDPR